MPQASEPSHPETPKGRGLLRRALRWAVGGVLSAVAFGALLGCCVFSAPAYEGPESDHFDGEVFFNEPRREHEFADFLKWRMDRDDAPWPDWVEIEPGPPPPERVDEGDLRVTFVNHATCLVQMDGINVLTDPVWAGNVGPVSWLGPERHHAPGLAFEDLPPIDVVLISHNHYDALEVDTLRRLAEEHRPRIFVGLGITQYLDDEEITGGEDLDWWDEREVVPGVRVTAVPARHFSGRGTCDRNKTLWCAYVVEGPSGRVYFAGDTGWGDHFAETRERLGPMRLALLPIGSYRPRWFMSPVHIDPAQAVNAHQVLEAGTSLGIHYRTFALGDDGPDEPEQELLGELDAAEVPHDRFWALEPGESRDVP